MAYNILIFGASYGSLLATKLSLAGHNVKLVCLPAEAELINKEGTRVRMPVKGREGLVEIDSQQAARQALRRRARRRSSPADYDLVALAHAGAAIPLARRARAARRGGQGEACRACRS